MKSVFVAFLLAGLSALCSGDVLPEDNDLTAGTGNSRAVMKKHENMGNDIYARCLPGLWCYNGKRKIPEENALFREQKSLQPKPLPKKRTRVFPCQPGLHCRKRSLVLTEESDSHGRIPSSVREEINGCLKYPYSCNANSWAKIKLELNKE